MSSSSLPIKPAVLVVIIGETVLQIELRFDIIAKNEIILLMILDKFLNLQGTCIQGYRHLENIGIV